MSRIRGSDTGPERRVRSLLHRMGFRFSLRRRDLPGRPDIVLPKWQIAVFVHGCFWHMHAGCCNAAMPKTRTEFWRRKLPGQRESAIRLSFAHFNSSAGACLLYGSVSWQRSKNSDGNFNIQSQRV